MFSRVFRGRRQEAAALTTVPATRHRRVDKRRAVHQRRRGIRWTALALVHPTAGAMIKAWAALGLASFSLGASIIVQAIADS
jgi:hypothetical protein